MPSISALVFRTVVTNTYSSYTCWVDKPASWVLFLNQMQQGAHPHQNLQGHFACHTKPLPP